MLIYYPNYQYMYLYRYIKVAPFNTHMLYTPSIIVQMLVQFYVREMDASDSLNVVGLSTFAQSDQSIPVFCRNDT